MFTYVDFQKYDFALSQSAHAPYALILASSFCILISPLEATAQSFFNFISYLYALLFFYIFIQIRDALLFCFAAADTKSTNVPKTLVGLIHSGLSSDSSFIRKASFHFLSKLWKIEENIIGDIHKRIENILQMETEAIVRREGIFEITTSFLLQLVHIRHYKNIIYKSLP